MSTQEEKWSYKYVTKDHSWYFIDTSKDVFEAYTIHFERGAKFSFGLKIIGPPEADVKDVIITRYTQCDASDENTYKMTEFHLFATSGFVKECDEDYARQRTVTETFGESLPSLPKKVVQVIAQIENTYTNPRL